MIQTAKTSKKITHYPKNDCLKQYVQDFSRSDQFYSFTQVECSQNQITKPAFGKSHPNRVISIFIERIICKPQTDKHWFSVSDARLQKVSI